MEVKCFLLEMLEIAAAPRKRWVLDLGYSGVFSLLYSTVERKRSRLLENRLPQ